MPVWALPFDFKAPYSNTHMKGYSSHREIRLRQLNMHLNDLLSLIRTQIFAYMHSQQCDRERPCKIPGEPLQHVNYMGAQHGKFISFYLLYHNCLFECLVAMYFIMCQLSCIINNDHIFLSFGMYLPDQSSCHLSMAFQLLQNQASGHIKVQKGTSHVFYMATPSCHTTESVDDQYF